jgi:hypothetical protein
LGVGVSPRKIEKVNTSATTITATSGSRRDSKFDRPLAGAITPLLLSAAGTGVGLATT